MSMFCYQCEQTSRGTGCTTLGVCGKDAETAVLQDLLVHAAKGIAQYARRAGELGARAETQKRAAAAMHHMLAAAAVQLARERTYGLCGVSTGWFAGTWSTAGMSLPAGRAVSSLTLPASGTSLCQLLAIWPKC